MKSPLFGLGLVCSIVISCTDSSRAREERGQRQVTAQLVVDTSVESDSAGSRTVEVNEEVHLSIPGDFGPYELFVEFRPTTNDDWLPFGTISNVQETVSLNFDTPGEYRVEAVSSTDFTGWSEIYVLYPEFDFGIELVSHAPSGYDIQPFDSTMSAHFEIDVELAGIGSHEGGMWELIALDQFPFGPHNVILSGFLLEQQSRFLLPAPVLDPGRFRIRITAYSDGIPVSHLRSFSVRGER